MTLRPFRLRGEQERRRFLIGVATSPDGRRACATLVAATGRGLEARFDIGSCVSSELAVNLTAAATALAEGSLTQAQVATLGDELTDCFCGLLDELARQEPTAWPAAMLAGVWAPLPCRCGNPAFGSEFPYDVCRLAEVAGVNFVSHFPDRDLAVGGRGQSLDALPLWLLARHMDEPRLLIDLRDQPRGLWLPAARDPDGPNHIQPAALPQNVPLHDAIRQRLSARIEVRTLVVLENAVPLEPLGNLELSSSEIADLSVHTSDSLWQLSSEVVAAAAAAILSVLYQDQIPGNVPALTGAGAPRVLGQLTPGNLLAWNRLQRDLAFARPPIAPLRAAM